eukprot:CAMPEP_0118907960 /NCGR_PEP_ID=MMETSP1166-20130328/11182_1 /TAXON_ID=1104430 /ORGANISM="Chrysoreinhardia sp, Strain CCMP3193" /LENGTH=72 /DNA_ID=CAMNT_0006847339 /DNA_START=345 /DNA_END=560 /DNA_ORIENTATION=-
MLVFRVSAEPATVSFLAALSRGSARFHERVLEQCRAVAGWEAAASWRRRGTTGLGLRRLSSSSPRPAKSEPV